MQHRDYSAQRLQRTEAVVRSLQHRGCGTKGCSTALAHLQPKGVLSYVSAIRELSHIEDYMKAI